MIEDTIKRINELYHKSKVQELTVEEKMEQSNLRKIYIDNMRSNLKGQLDQISIEQEDGTIVNLGEKYGNKETH